MVLSLSCATLLALDMNLPKQSTIREIERIIRRPGGWKHLVEIGAIQGDPAYYSQSQATGPEKTEAIRVAAEYLERR